VVNAFHVGIWNQCTVNGVNGEDMASVRELAVAVSKENIVNVIIQHRRMAAIIVLVNALNIVAVVSENVHQVAQISGRCPTFLANSFKYL
jgi:hypothetical protein